jgi:TRAP-type C4-dicarboxylate transport system permease small subunit
MNLLEKLSQKANMAGIFIAGVFLAAMIAITCGNIFSRLVWLPIKGTYELMGFFGAIVTALALGYTQIHKAHISVDILVNRFPRGVQRLFKGINAIIGVLIFSIGGWQLIKWGNILRVTGEVSGSLRIGFYPIVWGVALGCFLLCVVLLVDLVNSIIKHDGEVA